MYRLWLIFAQAATVAVAVLFVVSTFRPEWLPSRGAAPVALVQQAPTAGPLRSAASLGSYHDAVRRATRCSTTRSSAASSAISSPTTRNAPPASARA